MENDSETTRGVHPQVPPAKPPDQSDGQLNGENPAKVTQVLNEAMSEDETTTTTMDEQPMAAVAPENRVSLALTPTNDPGGDHVGTAIGGPGVISRNHVGTRNGGPGDVVPNQGGNHMGTAVGSPGAIPRNHVRTENHGPGDDPPPPYTRTEPGRTQNPRNHVGTENHGPGEEPPPQYTRTEPGRTQNPRNHVGTENHGPGEVSESGRNQNPRNTNSAKITKGHFDRSMNVLIDAIRDLANDQHRDNLKLEANVGVSLQITQDLMQYVSEFQENIKGSHRLLHDKMATMCSKIANMETTAENSTNDVLERGGTADVKTLLAEMTEEIRKQGRTMADFAAANEKLEGLLRENQSPVIRQDSKRLKRVRVQSPTPEVMILEGANNTQHHVPIPAPPQTGPPNQMVDPPPGTIIRNGNLATTTAGPNGKQILRKPGPAYPGQKEAPAQGAAALPGTTKAPFAYIAKDGKEILRLPRPETQGQNRNTNGGPGARPKQNSYAAAVATQAAPRPTIPGFNMESQRAHHSQNNRGASHGQAGNNSSDRQPTKVKDDQFTICPETGNVKIVEGYKTVPYKSEKTKGRENKRHLKNLAQVSCELILFGIPTKNKHGDIMTSSQDRAYIAKFLRELRRYGYIPTNGDVVGNVRQWRNTRHPDHIPITITFRDEDTRLRVEEAALEGGLKGQRTPREGDEQYGRIGYVRRSLTERERKELKIRKEKRNSPAGLVFAEIRRREEYSRADQDDWAEFDLEGNDDTVNDMGYVTDEGQTTYYHRPNHEDGMVEYIEPMETRAEHNNNNNIPEGGGAMSEEAMMNKIEEMQRTLEARRAVKARTQAETDAARAAEAAKQTEEATDSDIEFRDPISGMSSRLPARRGSLATSLFGTPRTSPSVFATEPVFNYTGNLNLDRPNLSRPEGPRTHTTTPTPRGDESSASECEYA